MKTKGLVRFLTLIMAALVLISSLSISVFAEDDQMVDEGNGEYDESFEEDRVMSCAPPIWIIPIFIALAPLSFCFDMFSAFSEGDFSILEQIPELFAELFSLVFD